MRKYLPSENVNTKKADIFTHVFININTSIPMVICGQQYLCIISNSFSDFLKIGLNNR